MKSLKQASEEYVDKTKTGVISDLETIDINMELKTFEGEEFEYDYMEVEGKKYRVPNSVQAQIKDILKDDPNLQKVKVLKSGSGMDTRYTVVPK